MFDINNYDVETKKALARGKLQGHNLEIKMISCDEDATFEFNKYAQIRKACFNALGNFTVTAYTMDTGINIPVFSVNGKSFALNTYKLGENLDKFVLDNVSTFSCISVHFIDGRFKLLISQSCKLRFRNTGLEPLKRIVRSIVNGKGISRNITSSEVAFKIDVLAPDAYPLDILFLGCNTGIIENSGVASHYSSFFKIPWKDSLCVDEVVSKFEEMSKEEIERGIVLSRCQSLENIGRVESLQI